MAPFQKEWLPAGRKASSLAALLIRLIVNVYRTDYSINLTDYPVVFAKNNKHNYNGPMTKSTKKSKVKKQKQGYLFIAIGIATMAVMVFGAYAYIKHADIQSREDRIVAIYDSLKLSDNYQLTDSDIFGEKRVYEWDAGRTYSSSKEYDRGANVDVVIAELTKSIESAGFKSFDEPYQGSWIHQYHFKSGKNEYIRLSVMSKPKWDASRYDALMGRTDFSDAFYNADSNTGPSMVTIKVNLDDNNE